MNLEINTLCQLAAKHLSGKGKGIKKDILEKERELACIKRNLHSSNKTTSETEKTDLEQSLQQLTIVQAFLSWLEGSTSTLLKAETVEVSQLYQPIAQWLESGECTILNATEKQALAVQCVQYWRNCFTEALEEEKDRNPIEYLKVQINENLPSEEAVARVLNKAVGDKNWSMIEHLTSLPSHLFDKAAVSGVFIAAVLSKKWVLINRLASFPNLTATAVLIALQRVLEEANPDSETLVNCLTQWIRNKPLYAHDRENLTAMLQMISEQSEQIAYLITDLYQELVVNSKQGLPPSAEATLYALGQAVSQQKDRNLIEYLKVQINENLPSEEAAARVLNKAVGDKNWSMIEHLTSLPSHLFDKAAVSGVFIAAVLSKKWVLINRLASFPNLTATAVLIALQRVLEEANPDSETLVNCLTQWIRNKPLCALDRENLTAMLQMISEQSEQIAYLITDLYQELVVNSKQEDTTNTMRGYGGIFAATPSNDDRMQEQQFHPQP